MRACLTGAIGALCALHSAAQAQEANFRLGEILVTGRPIEGAAVGAGSLGGAAIGTFGKARLDEAASLIPGVTTANTGGSRNERLLYVRGFDRYQVPLSIDGVRIYRPADNRLDFGQLLTGDLAEIQVAKGYASVLDGPGAMGGAINLVTRKPTRALELEARAQLDLDRAVGYAGHNLFALAGTRQNSWYAQASYARTFRDHWTLPADFQPTTANEDGGARDFSRTEDWRVNAKFGFMPNATDEYTLSYTRQEGSKNAPLHVTDAASRYWNWPYSTIENIYLLSTTALGDTATFKTRLYRSRYDNLLKAWDNRSQNSQTLNRAFDSPYWDISHGGSAEMAVDLLPVNSLTLAFHYRHDEHRESQTSKPDLASSIAEPVQTSAERTWSLAAENRLALTPQLALTLGLSYDWRDLDRAEDYSEPPGGVGIYSFPLRDTEGVNGQGRLDWSGDDGSRVHFALSSRVRFPTLFERFSSQFGTAEPNPGLKPERATNAEVGASRSFGPLHASAALFYSWLDDALVSVRTAANRNQRTNIGSARFAGAEISLDAAVTATLRIGGNYGYIHRSFDVGTAPAGGFIRAFRLTDVPDHKGIVYASWRPDPALAFFPSIEFAGERMTVTPATANTDTPVYYSTGDHVLVNLRVDYEITQALRVSFGVRNAFDALYQLVDGYPEQGRSLFLAASAHY
jgi:iron complex outermembrane receptor protein